RVRVPVGDDPDVPEAGGVTPSRHAAVFALLFAALAIAFFALNGHNAWHPTDDGFVLAASWRVLNGQMPYRDFLYVRAPLTPYLHVVELLAPQGWQIQAGRATFYAELAAAAALPAVWAAVRMGLRATPRGLVLAAALWALALHNFPPMPWPTVDAVA